jgi:hypothetical protein
MKEERPQSLGVAKERTLDHRPKGSLFWESDSSDCAHIEEGTSPKPVQEQHGFGLRWPLRNNENFHGRLIGISDLPQVTHDVSL